jgi:hypothetical protein
MTTDTEKLTLLIGFLKTFAEAKTCYDVYGDDYRGHLRNRHRGTSQMPFEVL